MKFLKLFEDFKVKGLTINDIINCIENKGVIYCDMIYNYPEHDKLDKLTPVSIDDNGIVTIIIDGKNIDVDIKNINKIEF